LAPSYLNTGSKAKSDLAQTSNPFTPQGFSFTPPYKSHPQKPGVKIDVFDFIFTPLTVSKGTLFRRGNFAQMRAPKSPY